MYHLKINSELNNIKIGQKRLFSINLDKSQLNSSQSTISDNEKDQDKNVDSLSLTENKVPKMVIVNPVHKNPSK
jgi:hypothetical protein